MVNTSASLQDDNDTAMAALQHQEYLRWEQEAQEALNNAAWRPLTPSEQAVIAFLAGLKTPPVLGYSDCNYSETSGIERTDREEI